MSTANIDRFAPGKSQEDRAIALSNEIVMARRDGRQIALTNEDFDLVVCGLRAWASLSQVARGEHSLKD